MGRVASPQVDRSHYLTGYDSPNRFASYWHQIEETTRLGGRVLEIGIGNGTVTAVLRARGLEVTTVDIHGALGPDVIADVRDLPFPDRSFDTVLIAEVLEHLPWENLPAALQEIARVSRRGVVVSVPNVDVAFAFEVRVPNLMQTLRLVMRRRLPVRHALWAALQPPSWRRNGGLVQGLADVRRLDQEGVYCDQHFWELGAHDISRADFVSLAEAAGLPLVRDFRAPRFPYHHFFVFEQTDAG
jgi:SAM-dependent methyltransferase